MPIPLIAIVWDGPLGLLWIEKSSYDPDIHQLYVEPEVIPKTRRRTPTNAEVAQSI